MGNCYRTGYERGPWWDIANLRRVIAQKVIAGQDASFEKVLLKQWTKIPEYKNPYIPPEILSPLTTLEKRAGLATQGEKGIIPPLANVTSPDIDVSEVLKQKGGRPRGGTSRTTAWRRRKEPAGQGID